MEAFDKVPEHYQSLCSILEDFEPPSQEIFQRLKKDVNSSKRRTVVGAGRSGIIAEIFKDFLRNLGYSEVYGPDDVPRVFGADDLLIAITGSGMTQLTTEIARSAKNAGARVVGITSDENSDFVKKICDYIIHVKGRSKKDYIEDYYARQLVGVHTPLTLLGTAFELRSLYTNLSFIGNLYNGKDVNTHYKELCNLTREYVPCPNDFKRFYDILPDTISADKHSYGKVVGVGDGLSGDVCKFFLTRLSHCAKTNEERVCRFYKDIGNVRLSKNDLLLVVSGCGNYLPYNLAKVVKDELGTRIVTLTSYADSPLAKISDVNIYVPGRIVEKIKGLRSSYVPTDPRKSIFELRSIIALESFVYSLALAEGITEEDMRNKHSNIT